MIGFLKGQIFDIDEKYIVLLCDNIGYEIKVTNSILTNLKKGEKTDFFIHSHIKEDIFDLYGFKEKKELKFFKKLISINGIGPKVGLEILNKGVNEVSSAIINSDEKFICSIPGIGKKTAQRIILELKGKIDLENINLRTHQSVKNEISDDIIEALKGFGYSSKEIEKTLSKLPKEIKEEKDIISYFLKHS